MNSNKPVYGKTFKSVRKNTASFPAECVIKTEPAPQPDIGMNSHRQAVVHLESLAEISLGHQSTAVTEYNELMSLVGDMVRSLNAECNQSVHRHSSQDY